MPDYIGAFAVTAGIGIEKRLEAFEKQHDDYNAIMLKALADRLAEAFTELLHKRVRREFWGYAKDEALDNDDADRREVSRHPSGAGLSGVPRPHRERRAVRAAARAERAGIALTEIVRDVPGVVGERFLSRASAVAVLRGRQDRPRPGRGLRAAQGHAASPRSSAGSRPTLDRFSFKFRV